MDKTRTVTLGLVQMHCMGSPGDNLRRAVEGVANAARAAHPRGTARVVPWALLLPASGRPEPAFAQAEPLPGPTTAALSAAARENGIFLVGGSIFEKTAEGRFFNTSPVFNSEGQLLGTYRKTHIPEDVLYHEQHYFAPGDTGIQVFDTPLGRIGP